MATYISKSPEDTFRLGEGWGRVARRGWVVAVEGDLGAGKTQLVKGIAQGLGVTDRVHSPTFTLVNEYRTGREPLFHLDLYRLDTVEQIHGAGLEIYLKPEGISVIEWADRWPELAAEVGAPGSGLVLRRVRIEVLTENERRIEYEDTGD
jgi:tRNA threonylcarbamoyladenosine biosynthesis protein TsaE